MSTKPDALLNLADAMAEDILNTPDDEVLREVQEDYGDPRALANKFDQILERAEKQVFATARAAASPQVRSSFLDLPISLADETIRRVKGIFDLDSRLSEFLSSLRPRTLAWSSAAAAVVIFVQAAVITDLLVKEQGASSGPSLATPGLPRPTPPPQRPNGSGVGSDPAGDLTAAQPQEAAPPMSPAPPRLSDEEIAALVAGGHQLMVAGDIPNARLALQLAEIAGNAAAALELGATYDPIELEKLGLRDSAPDIAMSRALYQKAKDLGSTEAAARLERLAGRESQPR